MSAADAYAGTPRHVWQALFVLVSMIRPEWPISRIADATFAGRHKHPFPELSAIALKVAQDRTFKGPGAIRFAATGVIAL